MAGELDHHNAVNVREEIDRRFSTSNAKNLVFNLQKLAFMDSSGLGILIGRYKTVSAMGGKTAIAAPSLLTRRLIELAGVHRIIPIYETAQEAVGGVA
ncbi:MAG: anti-sigma factor antagonist [Clostridia bacterium]|nr:anti-sigma factor antagonist [Clostridia bacterium]